MSIGSHNGSEHWPVQETGESTAVEQADVVTETEHHTTEITMDTTGGTEHWPGHEEASGPYQWGSGTATGLAWEDHEFDDHDMHGWGMCMCICWCGRGCGCIRALFVGVVCVLLCVYV